jgi:Cu-Zn family superoxide dismutase
MKQFHRSVWAASAVLGAVAVAALFQGGSAGAATSKTHAVLRDASGERVGEVRFSRHAHDGSTYVEAVVQPNANVKRNAFHGFHIHANNDPATGSGCRADPADPSDTWFLSADGHLSKEGQSHQGHQGDMPSVLVQRSGAGHLMFTTDRIRPADVVGKAVILHAKPDNFANIPIGDGDEDYEAESDAATVKTGKTGNAGDRVACGVVQRG